MARLVYCNDYYMVIGISITRNILNWNVISITVGSQIAAHTLMETGNGPNEPNTINL